MHIPHSYSAHKPTHHTHHMSDIHALYTYHRHTHTHTHCASQIPFVHMCIHTYIHTYIHTFLYTHKHYAHMYIGTSKRVKRFFKEACAARVQPGHGSLGMTTLCVIVNCGWYSGILAIYSQWGQCLGRTSTKATSQGRALRTQNRNRPWNMEWKSTVSRYKCCKGTLASPLQ